MRVDDRAAADLVGVRRDQRVLGLGAVRRDDRRWSRRPVPVDSGEPLVQPVSVSAPAAARAMAATPISLDLQCSSCEMCVGQHGFWPHWSAW